MAIDVYEQEANLFFQDLSSTVISDDVIQRLVSFPNVMLTGHQAFFTHEALRTILNTTLASVADFAAGRPLVTEISLAHIAARHIGASDTTTDAPANPFACGSGRQG